MGKISEDTNIAGILLRQAATDDSSVAVPSGWERINAQLDGVYRRTDTANIRLADAQRATLTEVDTTFETGDVSGGNITLTVGTASYYKIIGGAGVQNDLTLTGFSGGDVGQIIGVRPETNNRRLFISAALNDGVSRLLIHASDSAADNAPYAFFRKSGVSTWQYIGGAGKPEITRSNRIVGWEGTASALSASPAALAYVPQVVTYDRLRDAASVGQVLYYDPDFGGTGGWRVVTGSTFLYSVRFGIALESGSALDTIPILLSGDFTDVSNAALLASLGGFVYVDNATGYPSTAAPSATTGGNQITIAKLGTLVDDNRFIFTPSHHVSYAKKATLANNATMTIAHHADVAFTRRVMVAEDNGSYEFQNLNEAHIEIRFDNGAGASPETATTLTNVSGGSKTLRLVVTI